MMPASVMRLVARPSTTCVCWIPAMVRLLIFLSLSLQPGSALLDNPRGPVFITQPPYRVDFSNSTGASLECSAHGFPAPSIRWEVADGLPVYDVAGVRHLFPNGTLYFSPFRAELYHQEVHAGKYQCVASSPLGVIRSRPSHVRAVVQQYYEVQVYDEFVIVGNTAVLKCHIPPFVKEYVHVTSWIRNHNTHIQPTAITGPSNEQDRRYTMISTGELYLHHVSTRDGMDTYRCQTVNRLTQEVRSSAPGRVVVSDPKSSVPPRITHCAPSISVFRGGIAQLPCAAQSQPLPSHKWFRLRGRDSDAVEAGGRITQLQGLLVMEDIQPEDSGLYVCRASNSIGEEKCETQLSVSENLSVYVDPQDIIVDVGQDVKFSCMISGNPVTAIEWLKDGRPVVPGGRIHLMGRNELMVERVETRDRGMYQCLVTGEEDGAQGTGQLALGAIAPSVNASSPTEGLHPGTSALIRCVATGSPLPEVSWYLDEVLLIANARIQIHNTVDDNGNFESLVNVSSINVQDGGYYRCVARNAAGEANAIGRLKVFGPPGVRRMPDVMAVAGKEMNLFCPALGHPIENISWKKDGSSLPTSRRQRVLPNGTLRIAHVAKSVDEGIYNCIVHNGRGQSAQQAVTVQVTVPPVIDSVSFPGRHMLHVGARARLQCVVAEGDLPLTIKWLKDGLALGHKLKEGVTVRRDDDFSSVLAFSRISSEHRGNYTCIASNQAASVNITTQIVVDVPPLWLLEPQDLSITFRSDGIIDCSADGSPYPTITWKKAAGRFDGDYRDLPLAPSRLHIFANGSLFVRDATEAEAGFFLCEASNSIGQPLSKVVQVKVLVPAHFEVKYLNKSARRGESVQLECRAKGDEPLTIVWSKDGVPLDSFDADRFSRRDFGLHQGTMSELVIFRADRQDGGTYTCRATNDLGQDDVIITLVIREPPEAPDIIRIVDHSSHQVHLSWIATEGSPSSSKYVVQYKLSSEEWGSHLPNVTVSGNDTAAIIRDLHPGTSYSFRIFAINDLGPGQPSNGIAITTDEEAPSGPPRDIHVESAGSETLIVSWKPPPPDELNGELQGVHVGLKMADTPGQYTYKTVKHSKESAVGKVQLTPLRKFTNYSVIVQAFNHVGAGPASVPLVAMTDEDVPNLPPEAILCRELTSQSLQVSWNPPPTHALNGVVAGYKVLHAPVHPDEEEPDFYEMKLTSSSEVTLHDLEKWTNYSISVLAFTKVGDGVQSSPHYCQTKQDVPNSPGDIKALVVSAAAILVSWRKPRHPNGVITKYTVYMRTVDSSQQKTVKFSSISLVKLTHEVGGLEENVRYEFWVTASTSIGEGESTRVVTQTPKAKAPARVAVFPDHFVTSVNDDVILSCQMVGSPTPNRDWRMGTTKITTSSRVHVTSDGSLQLWHVKRTDSGNYTCFVDNAYGSDEVTHVLQVRAPPSAIMLQVTMTSSTTIHVSWNIKDDGGSPIRGCLLNVKREYGEWEQVRVARGAREHLVDGLNCGTQYQLEATCYNVIGSSEPSSPVISHTDGAEPGVPQAIDVIRINTTTIALMLNAWPDNGCPVRYFVVQYKAYADTDWLLVANNVQPQHDGLVIPDLQPATTYMILITAHNDAGSTVARYEVATLPLPGMTAAIPFDHDESNRALAWDISVTMPLVASLLALLIMMVGACIFAKHRKVTVYQHTKSTDPRDLRTGSISRTKGVDGGDMMQQQQQHLQQQQQLNVVSRQIASRTTTPDGEYDDVCPYATFSLTGYEDKTTQAMQLRTFGMHEADKTGDSLVPISELYSKVTKRPKVQEIEEGILLREHRFPSAEDMYGLYPAASERQMGRYSRPLDENFCSSDWNVRKKRDPETPHPHITEHVQVPDLLYHGTDSSSPTPNDSSPDDNPAAPHRRGFHEWRAVNAADQHPPRYAVETTALCVHGYPECRCQMNYSPGNAGRPSGVSHVFIAKKNFPDEGIIRV